MSGHMFEGMGVALITPFKKDGTIDFKSLGKLIEYQVGNNASYIVALGTTGEPVTQTDEEKRQVVDFVVKTVNNRVPVVVGLGGNNTQKVVEEIKNFDFNGIAGILSVSPCYNKPTQEGIYLHYKAISEVSPVPIILYNVPGRTSSNMKAETTLKLARDCDNVVAVKEASGKFDQITKILINRPEGFAVLSGDDALTLPLLALGIDGVISVIGNAFTKDFAQLVDAGLKGDFDKARKIQYKLNSTYSLLFCDGNPGGIKALLSAMGFIENNLRLPLAPVNDKTYQALQSIAREML